MNCSLNQLRDCLQNIFHWMTDSKLKLNANKTEFLIIGTQKLRGKLDCFFLTLMLNQNFTPAVSARNLGVTFDNSKNLDSIFHKLVIAAFITFVTFVIFTSFSHPVPLLKSLHWLPFRYRIIFKICTISYQALSSKQPAYLHLLLAPARHL